MDERQLNHDIVSLFKGAGAFAYKIPDPIKAGVVTASKRPFDGFAIFPKPIGSLYFESKLIKNRLQAFRIDRIEPHQMEALLEIKHNGGHTAIILGIWIPRKDYYFIPFDPELLSTLQLKSISKKILLSLYNSGHTIPLHSKDTFNPLWILERMVYSLDEYIGDISRG